MLVKGHLATVKGQTNNVGLKVGITMTNQKILTASFETKNQDFVFKTTVKIYGL